MAIRTMTSDDVDLAFEINEDGIDVDAVDRPMFERLFERSLISLVAVDPSDDLVGLCFVIDAHNASDADLPPRSAWAIDRPGAVLHLERVAFRPEGSGHGLGVELFDQIDERVGALARSARTGGTPLTAMVKVEPLNQHGWDFFSTRGFDEIDRCTFDEATWALVEKRYPG